MIRKLNNPAVLIFGGILLGNLSIYLMSDVSLIPGIVLGVITLAMIIAGTRGVVDFLERDRLRVEKQKRELLAQRVAEIIQEKENANG